MSMHVVGRSNLAVDPFSIAWWQAPLLVCDPQQVGLIHHPIPFGPKKFKEQRAT
jgi:hypothetical protein